MKQSSPEPQPNRYTAITSASAPSLRGAYSPPSEVAPAALQELRDAGFDLLDTVARGGFGVVYRARERALERDVAIKLIDHQSSQRAGAPQPMQEIASLSALRHPNVVPLYGSGILQGGIAYLVMPWIDGSSLRARLARDVQLPVETVLRIGIELADALAAFHARGLVHRDVKPENVLLDGERAILIDMGLVCAKRDALPPDAEAEPLIGTPSYMSPEQWTPGGAIDGRVDVYGLGCLLYELLTGALRHERNPLRSRAKNPFVWTESAHASDLLSPPQGDPWRTRPSLRRRRPDAPVSLERLLYRALDPDPAKRLSSAPEFKQELEAVQRTFLRAPTPLRGLRALLQAATSIGRTAAQD